MAALVASPPATSSNTETNNDSGMVLPVAWSEGNPSIVDHRNRIAKIQQLTGNRFCADCHAESPQWSSILLTSNESSGKVVVEGFGVVICEQCAVHHLQELGEERCFLKYLQYFHEWTPDELDILEFSGNLVTNGVYEAKLSSNPRDGQRCSSSSKQQGKFIKRKYRKLRYYQQERFNQALEAIAVRIRKVEAMRKRRKSLEEKVQVQHQQSSVPRAASPPIISQVGGAGGAASCARQGSIDSNNVSSGETRGSNSSNRTSLRMSSVFRRGSNFKQGSSMDFSGSSVLSMAESMVGSSCGFDLEDDEDFFLACARATANGSAIASDESTTTSTTTPPIIRADDNSATRSSDGIFWDENCLPQFIRDETAQEGAEEEEDTDYMIEEEEVARAQQPEKKTLPGISSSTSSLSSARSSTAASVDQSPRQPHRHASPHRRRRSSKEQQVPKVSVPLPKVLSPMRRTRKTMLRRMLNSKEYNSSSSEEEEQQPNTTAAGTRSSNRRKSDSNMIMSIVPLVHQRGRTRRASAPPDVAAAAVTTTPSNPVVEQTSSTVGTRATTATTSASTAATQGEETDAISTTATTTTTAPVVVELNNKPAERTRSLSPCPSPAQEQREIVPQAA